ncbi:4-hydroxy-tetrahydrodipicolinate reductase, partial [Acidimicrobiaceae bacterium USS-CC1]|nr:4-hydroxy-tetrahydrodipicolinate reductase [Acidiferrimicrobium australe]
MSDLPDPERPDQDRGATGPALRVGVVGAAGRMGATVCAAVDAAADLE